VKVLQALQRVMQFVEWVGHVGFLSGWLISVKASGRDTCRVRLFLGIKKDAEGSLCVGYVLNVLSR
jgi:hypothetical protein